jgi:hypothetical protein
MSEVYEKFWETGMPRGEFKQHCWFFAEAPNIACTVIVALFQKIYDEVLILTVFSNIGVDVKYRCFNEVYDVRSVSQPDMHHAYADICKQLLNANDKTGFAE